MVAATFTTESFPSAADAHSPPNRVVYQFYCCSSILAIRILPADWWTQFASWAYLFEWFLIHTKRYQIKTKDRSSNGKRNEEIRSCFDSFKLIRILIVYIWASNKLVHCRLCLECKSASIHGFHIMSFDVIGDVVRPRKHDHLIFRCDCVHVYA